LTAAFAEFVVVPAENAVVMEQSGPIEYGALVEPLAVGFHAARQGAVNADDRVLIVGGGPIGQACLLAARRLGATKVALSEPDDGRRARASDLGATVFSPTSERLAEQINASLGGRATVVLDAVGSTQSQAAAMALSAPGARIVLVGMAHPSLEVAAYEVSTHERTIIGSFCYSPTEFAETATWVSKGAEHLDILIDDRVGFEQAQDAFSRLAAGDPSACKVMVFPSGFPGTQ
jgi:threonine dehydrogenase-like Zn-dependent dehydrogenase